MPMMFHNPYDHLTNRQRNFCEYGGTFGMLLTLTCLIQHLVAVQPMLITNIMIPFYLFMLVAFLLLALQKHYSILLVILGAVFSMVIEVLWIKHSSVSLVVILLFLYHVILLVMLYTEDVPPKLKQKRQAQLAEEQKWSGKI